MPLSSAAGAGGYAKTLATVFLRPYGLALPCGGTSPVARNDTQTWWDVEGEISQLPTPNVYRSPHPKAAAGDRLGVSVWELDKRQSVGAGSYLNTRPSMLQCSNWSIVNAGLLFNSPSYRSAAYPSPDRYDLDATSDA